MKFLPHNYQTAAIHRVVQDKEVFAIIDLGLGKTIITLTSVVDLHDSLQLTGGVLLFGTKRIIYNVWEQEAAKWDHTRYLRFVNLHETGMDGFALPADFYLINYEQMQKVVDFLLDPPFTINLQMIVYDESSKMKSPSSKRYKSWKKVLPQFERRLSLTATPAPNSIFDVFSQAYITDSGKCLGRFHTKFKEQFFYPADYRGYKWLPVQGAEERIYQKLAPIVIRMEGEDYLELPELVINPVYVTLPDDVLKQYKKFEKEYFIEFNENDIIEASTASVLSGKLRQFAQGAIYTEKPNYVTVHNEKVDALEEVLESIGDNNTLVGYFFHHDRERLNGPHGVLKGCPFVGGGAKERDANAAVTGWQNGTVKRLLVQPASAAHGLNLQGGGHHIVLFALDWNLEYHKQLIGRLRRQGQENRQVFVHCIIARNTVDEAVFAALAKKDFNQQSLLNAMKVYQKELRLAA